MKSNNSTLLSLLVAAAVAILSGANVHAQEPEPIGLMLSTVGVVTAEDADGNVRRLQRRSAVFEGDTLITANRARAQVRFNDRGLVALQPNTSFFIEEHNFEGQEDGTESAVYSLLRGGLQAITGLIGRTNRDRYQVSTPIATIGLRGTHWAATFCTAECDGNAPGLYGGVADGGIDVCNGGGCTAVETNTYFYTPDANTQATTLLAPPSVVFAAVEDTEEEEGEEAGTVAETDGGTPADGDDDTTTPAAEDGEAPTTEATADIATFVETAGAADDTVEARVTLSSVSLDDTDERINAVLGLDDTSEIVAENRETVVEEEITAATQTTPAPAGAVVALASARGNPENADQSAALEVLVYPSGDSPNEDDFALPVAGFVDATDPNDDTQTTTALGALAFNLEQAGCDPCLYATAGLQGTTAELVESIETTVDGVDVFLGRWNGDALLFNSSFDNANGDLNALQDHHYAIALTDSGFAFSPALPSAQVPEIAVFSLLEATAPTDGESNTGSLNTFDLYMDLYMQLVTRMDIEITFDDREITAALANAFGFAEGAVAGLSAPLTGSCSGDGCGTSSLFGAASLSFIGESSEHILGSYALDTLELDQSVFGTYLLGYENSFNPLVVTGLVGTSSTQGGVLLSGTSEISGLYLPFLTDFVELGSNSAELANIYDTANIVAGLTTSSTSFDANDGTLVERGTLDLGGGLAYFGTWSLTDFSSTQSGVDTGSNGVFNFMYSTLLNDFGPPVGYQEPSPSIHNYSYLGGPSPVDENGNLGEINSIDLGLDLFYQNVASFEIELEIADRLYEAGLISVTDLADVVAGSPLFLMGTCSNGDCSASGELLYGSANLSFFTNGLNEPSAAGSFGLQTVAQVDSSSTVTESVGVDSVSANVAPAFPPGEHSASGLFVLQTAGTEDHPDYVNDPQSVLTEGVASVAITGTEAGEFAPLGTTQTSERAAIGLAAAGDASNALVSFEDTDEPDDEGGSFNVNEGVLVSFDETSAFIADNGIDSASQDFYVNIGRWHLIDSDLVIQGDPVDNTTVGHFAYSDTPTVKEDLFPNPFDVEAPILSYSLVDSTKPSDESDHLGTLYEVELEIDLYQQLIQDFSMSLSIGERDMDAWLYEPTRLGENSVRLLGECFGGDCLDDESGTALRGELSIGLIGLEAEGALGSYGLWAGDAFPEDDEILTSGITATGVFVLGRDSVVQSPDWYESSAPHTIAASGKGMVGAMHLNEEEDYLFPSQIGLIVDEDNSFSYFDSNFALHSYESFEHYDFEEEFESFGLDGGALLIESDSHTFGSNVVHWGQWFAPQGFAFTADGMMYPTGTNAHYGWSDGVKLDFSYIPTSAEVVYYDYAGGTSPTDAMGNAGTINEVELGLDLFMQAITHFEMDFDIAERSYFATMHPTDTTHFLEEEGGAELELVGFCAFGACGEGVELEGETSLLFVGDTAGAEAFDHIEGVIGSFALEAQDGEDFDEEAIKDLLDFDPYRYVTETNPGEEFDISPIGATGTYFLLGEAFENELYFDLESTPEADIDVGTGVAALANGVLGYCCSYEQHGESSIIGGFDDEGGPADDDIFLTSLVTSDGTVDNLVVGFDSFSMEEDYPYGYITVLEEFRIVDAVLAEQGGFGNFLADNDLLDGVATDFGINWGRWFASYATYQEGEFDEIMGEFASTPSSEDLGMDHHFVYTDGPNGINPTADDPTEVRYSYVGGTSPTDEWGRTGTMSADLYLDLYTQTLSNFEMKIAIGDRRYYAEYDPYDDYYGYGYMQGNQLGLDLEELLTEEINLRGICVGGICDEGMDYGYGNGYVRLEGSADLMPFGPNGEGFLGGFELEPDHDEGTDYPDIAAFGTFVLAQEETRDHIGWQVDPIGADAEADSVAVMSGSLIPDDATPTFDPFASVADLTAGDSFTTITIEDRDNIVDSILESNPSCLACEFEVQDAVVILADDVSTNYQYIDNPADISWATWANQDIPDNDWLFAEGDALDSSRLLNTIYANNLTSAAELMAAVPLTGYIDDDPTEILGHYRYAGGPSPVYYNGAAADPEDWIEFAFINEIELGVDFLNQTIDYFDADIRVGEDYYSHYDIELGLDSTVPLTPVTAFDLTGYCDGCGSSSYDEEYFQGHAEIAFVGDRAEQVVGGLAAYSDGTNPYGSGTPNLYAVEAAFVLNQDFDMDWVEASELRVGEPALAAIAPSFLLDSSIGSLLPFLIVDDLSTDDAQLELTDFQQPYNNVVIDVFSGFSTSADFLDIDEGHLDDFGRAYGGSQYYYGDEVEDPWFVADWGVWDSQSYNFNFPSDVNHAAAGDIESPILMPWVTSRDLTLELPDGIVTGGLGTTAKFVLLDGPDPVDLFGNDGYLEEILMEFDFATATVVDFYLSAKDSSYQRFEMMLDTVTIDPITDTRFVLDLVGTCDTCGSGESAAEGSAVFAFLGDNAEGAAGSFGLQSEGYFLTGAYVLHQNDHWVDLPDTFAAEQGGVVAFTATEDDPLAGNTHGFYIDGTNTADLLTVQSFDHTHPNALAGFDSTGTPCGDCSWDLTQGELRDYDNTGQNSYWDYLPDAYWGRWESQDQLEIDGVMTALTHYQHFAYSPDPSQYTDDVWENAVSGDGTWLVDYDHTNPSFTTSSGESSIAYGGLDVNLQLNYYEQQIDSFTMDVYDIDGIDYYTSAAGPVALDAAGPFANIPLTGYTELVGTSTTHTSDVTGSSAVFIIGVDAEAAIGTFDIASPLADQFINGAFFLGED